MPDSVHQIGAVDSVSIPLVQVLIDDWPSLGDAWVIPHTYYVIITPYLC